MMYWLYIAISLSTGEPGTWHHYPLDYWENERECQEAQRTITSNFSLAYQEKPGLLWVLYCKAESKT